MPYISKFQRVKLDAYIRHLIRSVQESKKEKRGGDLNYIISQLLSGSMEELKYHEIQEVIGVLECAKLELYRRLGSVREDEAIESNGDISGYSNLMKDR